MIVSIEGFDQGGNIEVRFADSETNRIPNEQDETFVRETVSGKLDKVNEQLDKTSKKPSHDHGEKPLRELIREVVEQVEAQKSAREKLRRAVRAVIEIGGLVIATWWRYFSGS